MDFMGPNRFVDVREVENRKVYSGLGREGSTRV